MIPKIELNGPQKGSATSHTITIDGLAKAETRAGVTLTPGSPSAAQPSAICTFASKRDRFDWCEHYKGLPTHIWSTKSPMGDFWRLEVLGLLNVVDGKAYLLGLERESYTPGISLIEVSRDRRSWQVYRFMSPEAGMGLCESDAKGYRPDRCWRRISMSYLPEKNLMMVEDYYPFAVGSAFPAR